MEPSCSFLKEAMRRLMLCLVILIAGNAASMAQEVNRFIKVDQNFDHGRTGFDLIGAHKAVPCETCHAGAVFKGVPSIGFHRPIQSSNKLVSTRMPNLQCLWTNRSNSLRDMLVLTIPGYTDPEYPLFGD